MELMVVRTMRVLDIHTNLVLAQRLRLHAGDFLEQ